MDCDQCGRQIDNLPYSCEGCEQQFCVEHRLPEEHGCVALTADQVGQELKREQGEGDVWFKDEFRLSNSPDSRQDAGRSTGRTPDNSITYDDVRQDGNTSEECSECDKPLFEHEVAGCPYCGEIYCGDHLGKHRRNCDERDTESVESAKTVTEHYQRRTEQKQDQRKTRTDEIEEERKERFSSPDVNSDGTLSEPEYEDDIQSINSTGDGEEKSGVSNWIFWVTLAASILAIFFAYQFVL